MDNMDNADVLKLILEKMSSLQEGQIKSSEEYASIQSRLDSFELDQKADLNRVMEEVTTSFTAISKSLNQLERTNRHVSSKPSVLNVKADSFRNDLMPAEIMLLNLPKPQMMRLSVIYEWLDTEADYVRDLSTMINVI